MLNIISKKRVKISRTKIAMVEMIKLNFVSEKSVVPQIENELVAFVVCWSAFLKKSFSFLILNENKTGSSIRKLAISKMKLIK